MCTFIKSYLHAFDISVSVEFIVWLSQTLCIMESIIYEFMISEVNCSLYRYKEGLWTHEKGDTYIKLTQYLRVHMKVFCVLLRMMCGRMCFMVNKLFSEVMKEGLSHQTLCVLCCGSHLVLTWRRLWHVLWTSPLCVAAMGTPMPMSVPCVPRVSEYTQLILSHGLTQQFSVTQVEFIEERIARGATWWWKRERTVTMLNSGWLQQPIRMIVFICV